MSLRVLLEGWVEDVPNVAVGGICLDSRRAEPGQVFVAVKGLTGHGLQHAGEAVANGCVAVIHDGRYDNGDIDVPMVCFPDIAVKMGELASRFWAAPSEEMTVAAVTGTNGKTSVAHFIAQAWQRVHGEAGLVGTLGYGPLDKLEPATRTTPDPFTINRVLAGCIDAGINHVAMEASSHALEQGRLDTIQVDAAVFTNLSRDHLDYHADMEAYAAAKQRLFTDFAPRFSVINHDDMTGRGWIRELAPRQQVLSYGLAPGAELRGTILGQDADGMTLALDGPWGRGEIRTPLMGAFNVSNLLASAGALALLDMGWGETLRELEHIRPVPGRMTRYGGQPGQPVVVIDYAHTPDALAAALAAVRDHLSGRLTCVFGCGGNRDRGKRAQMGQVAEELADRLVITSDNPRFESVNSIINDVLGGMERPGDVTVEPDRMLAIRDAIAAAGPGDIVLVAGKGHENYQEVAGQRLPHSDMATVSALLGVAA
ncbi:UDP-N-acetylmuramoyl-L-alanyl-D-glutamate--2,6-diaminopimelate ligase [Marinihelvus fidelis]|uniref:UDP-N-acetylmuramoyl-L-alanyl-D-glutamate--2,6-diaminopimelate ligase n=2 Tax=Marinihelvus fidelis TaxID=2613842 RepID=A0A5N0T4D5_9GAMM|nr:UDP-N-acetylmuramoyl-L-alanyl-D-glutamate--2,6-diaminopimelate ligase [Marinihelvus fidelis]